LKNKKWGKGAHGKKKLNKKKKETMKWEKYIQAKGNVDMKETNRNLRFERGGCGKEKVQKSTNGKREKKKKQKRKKGRYQQTLRRQSA